MACHGFESVFFLSRQNNSMENAMGKGISILFANAKSWQNTRMLWNDGLRNGYGFPDSFRTRITERIQKEGIFISQFENTFIIYRANLQYASRFSSYNSITKRSYCKIRQSSCFVKFKFGNFLINLGFKPLF